VLSLTSREREVLQLMATGMSSAEIASMLSVGVATVRSHTYHLRRKLDLKDRAQVVSFAYRSGLRLPAG
jgi:DNA-binding CsgD family transcriptional regulator